MENAGCKKCQTWMLNIEGAGGEGCHAFEVPVIEGPKRGGCEA